MSFISVDESLNFEESIMHFVQGFLSFPGDKNRLNFVGFLSNDKEWQGRLFLFRDKSALCPFAQEILSVKGDGKCSAVVQKFYHLADAVYNDWGDDPRISVPFARIDGASNQKLLELAVVRINQLIAIASNGKMEIVLNSYRENQGNVVIAGYLDRDDD
jgi:hypothetical protein